MDDERLNEAIDEAARMMTAGEPRADFRARVLARIDSQGVLRSNLWRPALAGLTVAALIVTAVMLSRDLGRRDTPVSEPVATATGQTGLPVQTERYAPAAPKVRLPPSPAGFGGPKKPDTTAAPRVGLKPDTTEIIGITTSDSRSTFDIEPLVGAPIEPASIAVAAVAADAPIDVEPLQSVAPIAVTPLGIEHQSE